MIKLGILAAVVALAGYLGWQAIYPSVTIRYRLTIEVEVDGQPRAGSGVIQITYGKASQVFGSSSNIYIDVSGEAVVVDLAPRGLLFALLKDGEGLRSGPEWIVPNAFGMIQGGFGPDQEVAATFARLGSLEGTVSLSRQQLPLLVHFRDVADVKTVERVDPNHLEETFGPGVRLGRVSLELTRDPITRSLRRIMPSFDQASGFADWYRTLPYNSPIRIRPEHFSRGI